MTNKNKVLGKTLLIGVIVLFICMRINPSIAIDNPLKPISTGKILYVGGSGEDNYTNIKSAVMDAQDGDTVFVYDDSSPYNENIGIYKSIQLIGEDKNTTIIDGRRISSTIFLYGGGITISGFTIQGGVYKALSGGIKVFSEYNVISNNIIKNNEVGIISYQEPNDDNNLVCNNLITKNEDDGIYLYDADNWNISNNVIIDNNCHEIIFFGGSANTVISNNIIYSNRLDCIYINGGLNCTISNNIINSNDDRGLFLWGGYNNKVIGNKIFNCKSYGIDLADNKNNIIKKNVLENNGIHIWESYNNDFEDNIVNGKPIIYLENKNEMDIEEDAGLIILNRCTNITVKSKCINDTDYGIFLWESQKCTIIDNIFSSNRYGIYAWMSNTIDIEYNTIDSNSRGIYLENVGDCLIGNNNFKNNNVGLIIDCDKDNTLNNRVEYNNFINNIEQADFVVKFPWYLRPIRWKGNHWDDNSFRFLNIYIIRGKFYIDCDPYSGERYLRNYRFIDWHPTKEPYNIEV